MVLKLIFAVLLVISVNCARIGIAKEDVSPNKEPTEATTQRVFYLAENPLEPNFRIDDLPERELAPNPYKRIKVREPSINGKDLDGDVPYSTLVDLNNLRGKNERKQGAVRNVEFSDDDSLSSSMPSKFSIPESCRSVFGGKSHINYSELPDTVTLPES